MQITFDIYFLTELPCKSYLTLFYENFTICNSYLILFYENYLIIFFKNYHAGNILYYFLELFGHSCDIIL